MNQAPAVDPADREQEKISTGALPVALYIIGALSSIGGLLTLLSSCAERGIGGSLEAVTGASAFIGGMLVYGAGDVVRSLRLISGRYR